MSKNRSAWVVGSHPQDNFKGKQTKTGVTSYYKSHLEVKEYCELYPSLDPLQEQEQLSQFLRPPSVPVSSRYGEIKLLDPSNLRPFSVEGSSANALHLTQLLWKKTTKVGCGYVYVILGDGSFNQVSLFILFEGKPSSSRLFFAVFSLQLLPRGQLPETGRVLRTFEDTCLMFVLFVFA